MTWYHDANNALLALMKSHLTMDDQRNGLETRAKALKLLTGHP